MKKGFCVTVVRYGTVYVAADYKGEALDVAAVQDPENIDWGDFDVKDCKEDSSYKEHAWDFITEEDEEED